MLNDFS